MRLPPWQKLKPDNFPTKNPLSFLMPLFDAYAGPVRDSKKDDSRLNPILKDIESLPENILLIVPAIDILVHEQLTFIERIRRDLEGADGSHRHRKFEAILFEKGFHGWLECKQPLYCLMAELTWWLLQCHRLSLMSKIRRGLLVRLLISSVMLGKASGPLRPNLEDSMDLYLFSSPQYV